MTQIPSGIVQKFKTTMGTQVNMMKLMILLLTLLIKFTHMMTMQATMVDTPSRNKDLIIQKSHKVMWLMVHGTNISTTEIKMETLLMMNPTHQMVLIPTMKKNAGIFAKIGHHIMNLLLFLQDIGYY